MKRTFLFLLIGSLVLLDCNKSSSDSDCFADATFLRTLTNQPATVMKSPANSYYLVEAGTIDTKLIPCQLPVEFQVNGLSVTVSGEVKSKAQTAMEPCCTAYLVINSITR